MGFERCHLSPFISPQLHWKSRIGVDKGKRRKTVYTGTTKSVQTAKCPGVILIESSISISLVQCISILEVWR